ncbi:tRNA (adenosine(37)-N6)-threonylcarbamoyltransferase complex ATPase subunit type 1 TsaE [Helicobacter fennelliae]|nr:tRNA (adenosine(37)-N6)-threonylcarbamoyltransferase complex ATPase subunit type 1 TsaE [Helicobacter fennelliae]SQB98838.1 ATPase [Helicobacter fennelliae]STP08181.1 ATPase [Helicobacter fennelliae]STQ83911.1 ATPase [Helicobacter fennelliae]
MNKTKMKQADITTNTPHTKQIFADIAHLHEVFEAIKPKQNSIFLLNGEVGSGKTTFVKGFACFININEEVTSPTFSIAHHYGCIHHYDLYNHTLAEVLELGLLEWLSQGGIHFVEWGGEDLWNMLKYFHMKSTYIEIIPADNGRIYKILE